MNPQIAMLNQNPKPDGVVAIAVENIVKRYGTFKAVKGVSFSVNDGEIFGLLGPNGAGKSTLIRMTTTLVPITSGRAMVAGFDVAKESHSVRRVIGVIPQALTSDPDLTLQENRSNLCKALRRSAGSARQEHPGGAGGCGPGEMARCANQDTLRWDAAAPRNRSRLGT
jgi:ABC-type sugar transport system ATPase subunit